MARETLETGTARRYIKHPAADSASSFTQDGHPMDSGTWHIIANNANVLASESARQVWADLGTGNVSQPTDNGWDALDEEEPPSDQRDGANVIAWNLYGTATARMFGPWHLVRDRLRTSAPYDDGGARRLRVHVRYYSNGVTAFQLYVALTAGPSHPTEGLIVMDSTLTTTSAADQDGIVTFEAYRGAPTTHHTGVATASGPGSVTVEEVYCWVGWVAHGGTCGIRSIEGWELAD